MRVLRSLRRVAAFVLLRAAGAGAMPGWMPLRQIDLASRWLAGPWLYAAWPALDPAIAHLQAQGVACEPVRVDEYTGHRFTFFADPDDLPLELYESG